MVMAETNENQVLPPMSNYASNIHAYNYMYIYTLVHKPSQVHIPPAPCRCP